MASYKKDVRSSGTIWRVQIAITGAPRESGSFSTKGEAVAWASERETEIRRQVKTGINTQKTLQDAFDRYEDTVSAHKKGERWEKIRLQAIAQHQVDGVALGSMKLVDITSDVLGRWRDGRLKGTREADFKDKVMGSTVSRELNLISHVFNTAQREWKWIAVSPTKDVRRPKKGKPRDHLITDDEIERQCLALGYSGKVVTKNQKTAAAWLFAIETAMRAGEICGMDPSWIKGNVVRIPDSKNNTGRDVSLSPYALAILESLPTNEPTCFGISSGSVDALFRAGKKRAAITTMTFHDSRHLAITRLAKKLNVLELARMTGHKDLNELQTYYNETAAEIAKKL